jgi:hypothetical protein
VQRRFRGLRISVGNGRRQERRLNLVEAPQPQVRSSFGGEVCE